MLADGAPLTIRIKPDAAAGTLAVIDTGIGMDRQEMIDNLGTVARSGTRAFISQLAEAKEGTGLIGKFGVGFYSAFMVADRIEVTSRRAGASEAFVWRASGGEGFEIAPADAEQAARVPRGTEIVLHLKDDAKRFLEPHEIERIVKAYSDHIQFPIELLDEKAEPRQINTASALWQRPKSELKPEDYTQAYRSITGAFDEPAMTLHYRAEGRLSYAVLLFAPSTRPFDLFDVARKGRVKLYVRRVYITDDAELLPPYLRFVRGVVDSEDLPLNISREMLQNDPQVAQIRKALTGRVLGELESIAEKDVPSLREDLGGVRQPAQGRHLRGFRAPRPAAAPRPLHHHRRQHAFAQAICRRFAAQPDRDLLSGRRKPGAGQVEPQARGGARARHRGAAADRSGGCVLDHGGAGLRGQAAQVAEPGRGQFRSGAAARGGRASRAGIRHGRRRDRGGEERARRAGRGRARLAAPHRQRRLPGGGRPRPRSASSSACSRAPAAAAAASRSSSSTCAIRWSRRLGAAKTQARDDDVADLSALLLDQAQILDGEVPEDPAAFAARLNRLVVRGLPAG